MIGNRHEAFSPHAERLPNFVAKLAESLGFPCQASPQFNRSGSVGPGAFALNARAAVAGGMLHVDEQVKALELAIIDTTNLAVSADSDSNYGLSGTPTQSA